MKKMPIVCENESGTTVKCLGKNKTKSKLYTYWVGQKVLLGFLQEHLENPKWTFWLTQYFYPITQVQLTY